MIQKEGVGFEVYCDDCDTELGACEDTFQEAVEEARRAQWAVFKRRGDWTHLCPLCRSLDDALREFEGGA